MTTTATARPRPRYRPTDLLSAYLPASFFWSSTRGSLLADGVRAIVDGRPGARADAAADVLHGPAGGPDAHVVGAIGFGPAAPASLVVPAVVRRAGAFVTREVTDPGAPMPGTPVRVRHRPEPRGYEDSVARAVGMIDAGRLTKVVLARCVEVTGSHPVAVPALLRRLVSADPGAHAFAVDVTAVDDVATRTLVGASPELLVARRGQSVLANPLAGSAPRSADPVEDRERAAALLASEKDRHEHALVAQQVAGVLERFCADLTVPAEPSLTATATMWHLSSRIVGRIRDLSVSALTLAEALHPTPAVCGVPVDRARAAIAELEQFPRGYYGGLVGWTDSYGDGEWAVTIRCAEVCERTVTTFAGAGVVAGSEPASELAETGDKLRTLVRALGIESAP